MIKRIALALLLSAFASSGVLAQGGPSSGGPGPTPDPWVQNGSAISYDGCVLIPVAVTGGCKGNGSLNVGALYMNGIAVNGVSSATAPITFSSNVIGINLDSNFAVVSTNLALANTLTFTGKTITGGAFSGGTIDNAVIGATTPASGVFTSGGFGADPGIGGQFFRVNSGTPSGNAIAAIFNKNRSSVFGVQYRFADVGGLTSDANGAAFWRGLFLQGPSITDPVGGAVLFPAASFYHEFNSLTAPTTRNFVLDMGNLTSTSLETFRLRSNGTDVFTANTTGVSIPQTTASTSPTTGAFTVVGGAGIGSALNVGGVITGPSAILLGNVTSAPAALSGTILQVVNSGSTARILTDAFGGGSPNFTGRFANGTPASPTAVTIGNNLAIFTGFGYGATGYSAQARGSISMKPAETWTDTAQGTYLTFSTTPTTTVATAEAMRIQPSGGVSIGNPTFLATDPGAGNISVQNAVTGANLVATGVVSGIGIDLAGPTGTLLRFKHGNASFYEDPAATNNFSFSHSSTGNFTASFDGSAPIFTLTYQGSVTAGIALNTTFQGTTNQGWSFQNNAGTAFLTALGVNNSDNILYMYSRGNGIDWQSVGNSNIMSLSDGGNLSTVGNIQLSTAGSYANFGATTGSSGYGIRDNAGTMQTKNSGGGWSSIAASCSVWRKDFATLNAAIASLPSSGGTVCVGPGIWNEGATQTVFSGLDNVSILCAGTGTSVLSWTAASGGISGSFATPSGNPVYNQQFTMKGCTLATTAVSGGAALALSWATSVGDISNTVSISDIEITGTNDASTYWTDGIKLTNARNPKLDNVMITGKQEAGSATITGMQHGIYILGGSGDVDISAAYIFDTQYAIYAGDQLEGLTIRGGRFINNNYSVYWLPVTHNGTLFHFVDSHSSALLGSIVMDHVAQGFIQNVFFIERGEATANPYVDITLQDTAGGAGCNQWTIANNIFQVPGASGTSTGILVQGDCTAVHIMNNKISQRTTGIALKNTASSIVEGGNINFGSVTTFVSNTSTGSNINLLTNY